jgi:hypothetical protein
MGVAFYADPGPLTELTSDQSQLVRELGLDAMGLCRVAQGLLLAPQDATGAGLSEHRMAERNTRRAGALLQRVLELGGDTPLDQPRPAEQRVVGTCRHYAVVATAFLRACGVPARARCGFATYLVPPKKVDDALIDQVAEATHHPDAPGLSPLYERLAVPESMVH